MYLGKENFPEPGDIDKDYVDKVVPESLPNLLSHLQLKLEKAFAPQSSREKMHSLHVESLIRLTRGRMHAIEAISNTKTNGKQES